MDRILMSAIVVACIAAPSVGLAAPQRCGSMPDTGAGHVVAAADLPVATPMTTATVSPRIALIEAAKLDDAAGVRQSIDADITGLDARDGFGRSALHYAARLGHRDIIEILIDAGAPLESTDAGGFTPLLRSIQGGDANIETVRLLLDAGADRDARANGLGVEEIARSVDATGLLGTLAR